MAPHIVRGASLHKIAALSYTELNRRFPKPHLMGYPSVMQLEPTNACNLRCPLCPSGVHAFSRPIGMMPFSLYKELMDEIGSHLSLMVLWNWGEPFLHPDLPRMIRYAKSLNIAVITSSNAQVISDPSAVEDIVRSGLDTLAIAMDGTSQKTYESYRVGGSLDKVMKCLTLLRETKRRIGSLSPLVNVRVVVSKENEHELQAITDLARSHGADLITFRSASMPDCCGTDLDQKYAPGNGSYRMYDYHGDGTRSKRSSFTCRRPWKRLTVNWDGTIVGCEHDFDNTTPYGKFPDDGSVMQILNSPRARDFRRQFLKDKKAFGFCAHCPNNDRVVADCTVAKTELEGAAI
jgi:molybdenum cofactor biosynthesis enzyme MoaA